MLLLAELVGQCVVLCFFFSFFFLLSDLQLFQGGFCNYDSIKLILQ